MNHLLIGCSRFSLLCAFLTINLWKLVKLTLFSIVSMPAWLKIREPEAPAGFRFGGGGILGGPGAEPTGHGGSQDFFRRREHFFKKFSQNFQKMQKIFSKICKKFSINSQKFFENFIKKMLKMHYFSIFFKKSSNPCVKFFAPLDQKNTICWRLLRKILKVFLKKIAKNALF